jgi:monomeric isocitrate dehydrogenase
MDRARMAVTKWIPYSSAGAAISFVAGFVLGLPPSQVIVSASMAATLIFSGLLFQSYGREKEQAKTA